MNLKKHYHCNFANFDLNEFPIIIVTTNVSEPTLGDIADYQVLKNNIFDLIEEEVTFIFDTTSIKWIPADARIALGEGVRHSEQHYKSIIRKAYMVIPNVVANILFKGINLVSNTNLKYSIHKSYGEAYIAAKKDTAKIHAYK